MLGDLGDRALALLLLLRPLELLRLENRSAPFQLLGMGIAIALVGGLCFGQICPCLGERCTGAIGCALGGCQPGGLMLAHHWIGQGGHCAIVPFLGDR